ncbi:MAG: D-amino-acid transaminase [Gammaproteobacteria bacterium]|nr:D-amino-acid transaminase [Gammaproteobacteria bacterium]
MSRIVYVNGEFVNEAEARISIFDRGFLFADGVYEVSSILGGALIDNDAHLQRLERSLGELSMPCPASLKDIAEIQRELVTRNQVKEGALYLQVTRGVAERDFAYPSNTEPSLVMFTQARPLIDNPAAKQGISIITVPDQRWKRRDIKTIGLLPASMAKEMALARGADDAWLHEEGYITEGSSNNAYIVTEGGEVITRHLSNGILAGITRGAILRLSRDTGMKVVERPFSLEEAHQAKEAFVTSATTFVYPVIRIDGKTIGEGKPGPVTVRLRELYVEMALQQAAAQQR